MMSLDSRLRREVYDVSVARGVPPSIAELSFATSVTLGEPAVIRTGCGCSGESMTLDVAHDAPAVAALRKRSDPFLRGRAAERLARPHVSGKE